MKYEPRLTSPSLNNKYYLKKGKVNGGLNECLEIKNGECTPNCVGYAWGRSYEITKNRPTLCRGNAENWFGFKDGYKRGQEPKLGAIICWRKGQVGNASDGAGHVAIVEEIRSDGSIVTSNSAYRGSRFYTKILKKPYNFGSYVFQGFIYQPIEFDEFDEVEYVVRKNYTLQANIKVRTGPGTNYEWKNRSDITVDGKKHSLNQTKATLIKGTQVTLLECKVINEKEIWGRIPSGWIAFKYNGNVFVK